ncbi:tail assembly protein [Pectobacterium brasiliense]|nr:tail assembly protein [Pectobacterium brasiliense]
MVTQFGELPSNFTLLKPATAFDVSNGKEWVLDIVKAMYLSRRMCRIYRAAHQPESTLFR